MLLFSISSKLTSELAVYSANSDLPKIHERGRLIAVTDMNLTSYFIYRGEPMGFNYELLKAFANHLGLALELKVASDAGAAIAMVERGEADMVAMPLPDVSEHAGRVTLTSPIYRSGEVVVQRRRGYRCPEGVDYSHTRYIENISDLAGEKIYLSNRSFYYDKIREISSLIGDTIHSAILPGSAERLISMVANGEIDYTLVDESFARVATILYPDLDTDVSVVPPQKRSWAVKAGESLDLLYTFNSWFETYSESRDFAIKYANYFNNRRSGIIYRSSYYAHDTGTLSPWDDIIIRHSVSISWDWRLLISLMYQESSFRPHVTSRAGAYGLMQVMPATGEYLGIDITASPEENVRAGIMYLKRLENIFSDKVTDREERKRFVLASYNAGPGHILDAIRLAAAAGADTTTWHGSVEEFLLKKSDPLYYNQPEVHHGSLRGVETVRYVRDVMERYESYRSLVE